MSFAFCVLAIALATGQAQAQAGPTVEVDAMTDYRVRGLSWSDGEAAGQVYVSVPLGSTLSASAQATSLRGAARHGGADAGVDLAATYLDRSSVIYWYGSVIGHFFAGAQGSLDYGEVQGGVGGTLGPADLTLSASYAPSQDAIGGSNLYTRAEGSVGIWGTPYTLRAHIGRSSGDVDDPAMAARLRPDGSYTDWAVGAEYTIAPFSFNLTYSDTDISGGDVNYPQWGGDYGAKLVAGANVRF